MTEVVGRARKIYKVDPSRLEHGAWSTEFNKRVGEGDIAAAYSGDTIGLRGTIRKPFVFRGRIWVTVGLQGDRAEAYELYHVNDFQGEHVDYEARCRDAVSSRNDPMGFSHGVTVRFRDDWFVLCGPPVVFKPGTVVQPGLFSPS